MEMEQIEAELNELLSGLKTIENTYRANASARGVDVMLTLNADGTYLMERILVAKANALSALAPIQKEREQQEKAKNAQKKIEDSFNKIFGKIAPPAVRCDECDYDIEFDSTSNQWRHVRPLIGVKPHSAHP